MENRTNMTLPIHLLLAQQLIMLRYQAQTTVTTAYPIQQPLQAPLQAWF
ncbi:MAG: hypothetical protein ACOVQA_04280 [Thermoflexibacteraceae bacterium]